MGKWACLNGGARTGVGLAGVVRGTGTVPTQPRPVSWEPCVFALAVAEPRSLVRQESSVSGDSFSE